MVSNGQKLKFGPFENLSANSFKELHIHYENSFPFLNIEKLVRELWISHWGNNLAVEEHYVLKNKAAKYS